jgi:muramoyltetrapeptide carboxypeptidase
MPIIPELLSVGDTILVVSPSGKVNASLLQRGCDLLSQEGFQLEIGKHAYSHHYKFAGTHKQRLEDLQWALDHPEAKAIFCTRGGYGITYLIDQLDWTLFKSNPKWVIGFSDITALHHAIYKEGFCSIHGPILQGLPKSAKEDVGLLVDLLKGVRTEGSSKLSVDSVGSAKGALIGGNLSILINQLGTATELDYSGCILFIEEVGESLYHIDRMFLQLKRAGKLAQLKGLVVGQFTDLKETKEVFGQTVEEIVAYHCSEYDYPTVHKFPMGHGKRNRPVIHGGLYHCSSLSLLLEM